MRNWYHRLIMSTIVFICTFVIMAIFDIAVGVVALRVKEKEGHYLAFGMFSGALVTLAYLLSNMVPDRLLMSFCSSLYFIGVDLALIFFAGFVVCYTRFDEYRICDILKRIALGYFCFDALFIIANPFDGELAIGYVATGLLQKAYCYDMHLIGSLHLAYCYVMVAFCVMLFIVKTIRVPRVYRSRYMASCVGLIIIVLVNCVYLWAPNLDMPDYSVLLYGFMGILFYVTRFHHARRAVLAQAHALLIDQMGRAVILFDYEGRLITLNHDAEQFVSEEAQADHLSLDEFVSSMDWGENLDSYDSDASFFWRTQRDDGLSSWRVDFTLLRDGRGKVVSYLFVMTDYSLAFDLLTGFETQAAWERGLENGDECFALPYVVAVCDLTGLSLINERYGRDVGDEVLALLAREMREAFPETARFVRLVDANLMAVAPNMSEQEGHDAAEAVAASMAAKSRGDMRLNVQSCVEAVYDESRDVSDAARKALSGLLTRKLLVQESSHASLIASLVQMQQQNNGEAEDHVQRTREIGERLGQRLGLSDSELNAFALLCLLHDVGRVGIPLEIANKPGPLNETERTVMQSHATKGYKIANASHELEGVADLILHHHERWDGSGYPDGLAKDAIPLLSRIIAVVDTFDIMTHDQPYRRAISIEAAKEEIRRGAGSQFDPVIAAEFLAMLDEDPSLVDTDWTPTEEGDVCDEVGRVRLASTSNEEEPDADGGVVPKDVPMVANHYVRYFLDSDQRIFNINAEFTNLTGYTEEDLDTYNLVQGDLIPLEDREVYWRHVEEGLRESHEVMIEHRLRKKDGSYLFVMCYGREYLDVVSGQMRSQVIAADLLQTSLTRTLLREAQVKSLRSQQRWEEELRRDVTGVLTRTAFRGDVQIELMDPNMRVLLAIIDLDFFKRYNDTKGHPQGDALLVKLGSLLLEAVEEGGIAGRLGGDEFAVAFTFPDDVADADIETAARSLWSFVDGGLFAYDGVHVTMGVAIARGGSTTFSSLYSAADTVLYEAKLAGRGCCEVRFER